MIRLQVYGETMKDLQITVIIPSLNRVDSIRECLSSVMVQTLEQMEILCIDAGSTDGTLEILEECALQDKRIEVVQTERKSYGYQVNLGIRLAKGMYIGIVETDDSVDISMYQSLYEQAEKNAWPDFVKSGFYEVKDFKGRKETFECTRSVPEDIFGKLIILKNDRKKGILDLNHIWSGIYRRDFLRKNNVYLNETQGASYQDLGFSLLTGLLADTAIYIREGYYFYCADNPDSSVKSNSKWHCVLDEFKYVENEMVKRGKYTQEIRELILQAKPAIYIWNAVRLSGNERGLFLTEIGPEVAGWTGKGSADNNRKKIGEILSSKAALEKYIDEKQKPLEKFRLLQKMIEKGEKCILVSAGRYSAKLLELQNRIGKRYVEAVTDNDEIRRGSLWNGYTLMDIAEAVEKYKKEHFIIANRYCSDKICKQLDGLGVERTRMLVIDTMPLLAEIFSLWTG